VLPQTRSPARRASASRPRLPDVHRFTLLLVALLALGVAVRLPFLSRLGHAYDQDAYRAWMGVIQDYGLAEVFDRTNTDYVGYHYILWGLSQLYSGHASEVDVRDKELRVLLKLPGLAGDLLTGALVAVVAQAVAQGRIARLGGRWCALGARFGVTPSEAIGLAAATLFLFNPAVLYASAYWGQQDSLVTFFMLLACWLSWRRLPGWAGVALALGTIVKPQPLVLVPLLAWIVWQRTSWGGLLRGALAGVAVLVAGHAYFLLAGSGERMWQVYTFQLRQNEHLSFGAYNLWWPFERLADARPETAAVSAGGISVTYGMLASVLTVAVLGLAWLVVRRGGATAMLVGVGVWLAGYYLVAAGSHERYALPALAFLLVALPLVPRLRWPLLLYSAAVLANLLIALPLDRRWHQGDPLWLTLLVSAAAVVSVVGLGWVARHRPLGMVADAPAGGVY